VLDSRFSRSSGRRGLVVAGAVEGERHSLPLRIVADVVRLSGYDVEDLGADVPVDAFARAVTGAELVAVAVSTTTPGNEDAVQATVAAVRGRVDGAVPVLVGGGAVPDAATSE